MSNPNVDASPGPADLTSLPFFAAPAPAEPAVNPNAGHAAAHLSRAAQRLPGAIPAGTPALPPLPPVQPLVDLAVPPSTEATLIDRSDLPWDEIAAIRDEVSRDLANIYSEAMDISLEQREQAAQDNIVDRVRTRVDEQTRRPGDQRWSPRMQQLIRQAVFDLLFRLGRIQPLVDEPGVENIHINGFDDVWLSYADGRVEKYPYTIATSDRELAEEINLLAARSGEGGRSFTRARPRLHLDLPSNARLAAVAEPIATRPTVVIRIHRLVDVTIEQLVERDTLSRQAAAFLTAAVEAGVSIVTSGFPGAGKTTLLRALADAIPPEEKIVTIEMERELYLHKIPERHPRVVALEYRPGEGEPGADGKLPGEITLEDLVYDTLRLDTQRFIVGEVRGPEIYAMLQAMQSGVGSLSTLHAASADDSIDRMSALMLSKGSNTTPVYAYRMIEQNIKLIVQIAKITDSDGKPRRVVTEIAEIEKGEDQNNFRPIAKQVFRFDRSTMSLIPAELPSKRLLETLRLYGFDDTNLGV
ncbi:CpaF family protein [Micromonospora sp. DT81.3]|uniref:CpaF family protein n=1 Tax=Micromonospora sp. DT81.3 TaxID=3416523 RepID=UPI003CF3719E